MSDNMFWQDAPLPLVERLEDTRTGLGGSYPCGCHITGNTLLLCEKHQAWMDGWEARDWAGTQRRRPSLQDAHARPICDRCREGDHLTCTGGDCRCTESIAYAFEELGKR